MKNCLITARDPATANDLSEVIPALLEVSSLFVRILAQQPAYKILHANLMEKDLLEDVCLIKILSHDYMKIEVEFNHEIEGFYPDVLITGVSGPGYGIDEIALKICNQLDGIQTYSIQSCWGDINNSLSSPAMTMFVIDAHAAKITKNRNSQINTVVVGSFQSMKYNRADVLGYRQLFRKKLGRADDEKVISFFGQPLFDYAWYKKSVSHFISVLSQDFRGVVIVYKPHPKETLESINWCCDLLYNSFDRFYFIDNEDVLFMLSGSDLVVSLFSTVGYELQQLLARSQKGFAVPLYLYFDDACKAWFTANSGLTGIPLSDDMCALVVNSSEDLSDTIRQGLDVNVKEEIHEGVRIALEPYIGCMAHNKIVSEIENKLNL